MIVTEFVNISVLKYEFHSEFLFPNSVRIKPSVVNAKAVSFKEYVN